MTERGALRTDEGSPAESPDPAAEVPPPLLTSAFFIVHHRRLLPVACHRADDRTWLRGDACAAMVAIGDTVRAAGDTELTVRDKVRKPDRHGDGDRTWLVTEPGAGKGDGFAIWTKGAHRRSPAPSRDFGHADPALLQRRALAVGPEVERRLDRALRGRIHGFRVLQHIDVAVAGADGKRAVYCVESTGEMKSPIDDDDDADIPTERRGFVIVLAPGPDGEALVFRGDPTARVGVLGAVDLDGDGDRELWILHQLDEYDEHIIADVADGKLQLRGRAMVP